MPQSSSLFGTEGQVEVLAVGTNVHRVQLSAAVVRQLSELVKSVAELKAQVATLSAAVAKLNAAPATQSQMRCGNYGGLAPTWTPAGGSGMAVDLSDGGWWIYAAGLWIDTGISLSITPA